MQIDDGIQASINHEYIYSSTYWMEFSLFLN